MRRTGGRGRTDTPLREQDFESNDLPLRIDKTAKILPDLNREIEGLAHRPQNGT